MDGVIHLVEVRLSKDACDKILAAISKDYSVDTSRLKLTKSEYLLKDDLDKKAAKPRVKETSARFSFGKRELEIFEVYTEPDGIAEHIQVIETIGQDPAINNFKYYVEAERYVMAEYIKFLESKQ